jgi:hypothetical protein
LVVRSLRYVFHSSFSLIFAAVTFIGLTSLHAQAPNQTPDQTPAATAPSAPPQQPADNSPQPSNPSGANPSHNSSDAWKGLARDLEEAGMKRAGLHGGGEHGGPGGSRQQGPSGDNFSGSKPAFSSSSQDTMHYGSEMRTRAGAGIGSSDFDSGVPSGFSSDAGNAVDGNTGNQFGGTSGNGFRGGRAGSFNPGSISQLSGDLGRGLAAGGHTSAAAALGALPAANQLLRGGLNLPVNSSLGNFRLSYQSPFSLNNNFQFKDANGFGSPTAVYESPHARSGHVDFSASAKAGVGSATEMNGSGSGGQNGIGGHTPGHPGSSDPSSSVTFKLSF